jgi:hypothetical protein
MKDESVAALIERFNLSNHTFILPPSSFILSFLRIFRSQKYVGLGIVNT